MKFLSKTNQSKIIALNLNYSNKGDRDKIRALLIQEQKGFCAYSERYIKNTDSVHIEHFDGRKKGTTNDNYWNWYAVLAWMNEHKPKDIKPFLPILCPFSIDVNERIKFDELVYSAVNPKDIEALNLINFLGLNKYELVEDRKKHRNRIQELFELKNESENALMLYFQKHKKELSFITMLEHYFNLSLSNLLSEDKS